MKARQKHEEKQWAAQEEGLTEREKRFADLKAKVEAMPEEREATLKKIRKAIEGTSNMTEFQVLREIALEQAKQANGK
ncbi:MAG: hypothetical protein HC921_14155 [Synechococcaceae cyanobacterium SM2_3_1]|nr:hypothetical protein [Synechococcaceae cyanobacterium SM2_3_1]